jgi:uncharacterized protein YqeY
MRDRINAATKEAMKAGDKQRLSALRLINAAIKDRDIAGRVDEKGQATGRDHADDSEILQLLQKMIKQRRESEATYREAGRTDLADKEAAEIAVIEEFMPAQMSEGDVTAAVEALIEELAASGLKDMGRTMAALKEKYAGQMDFGKASGIVKARLSAG